MAKGSYNIQVTGIKSIDKKFMLRAGMATIYRTRALRKSGSVIVKDMKKLAPPYPLHMLKHGKRWWKPTGELQKSIKAELSGGKGEQDIEIGPRKSMTSYKYFPGDQWLALEFGHKHGWYGPRPTQQGFVRAALYQNVKNVRDINRYYFSKLAK